MQSTMRVGRESWQLLRSVTTHRGHSWRNTLVTAAQSQGNQTAARLLHVDKEIGLLRYYGLMGYLREKQWIQRNSNTTMRLKSTETDPSKPKIAFMITSAMRKDLMEELAYHETQIKQMTPLEASLILEHRVTPPEKDERLPLLIYQYETEMEAQANKQRERARMEQEQLNAEDTSQHQPLSNETTVQGTLWYEVVETNDQDGSSTVVGLYSNQAEADLGAETQQQLAQRRIRQENKPSFTYTVRATIRP